MAADMPEDPSPRLEALIARAGRVARGPSKVTTLERAVADHITPGMHLQLVSGLTRPVAICLEIVRRFAGSNPGFTLSAMSFTGPPAVMVEAGLLDVVITTFFGEGYPAPGPNPMVQRAFREGRFQLSAWSILSYTQRLLAGALGLPFIPTRSLAGSSMAEDNPDVVELPDGQGLGVRPLVPDVALIHAPAADRFGNTLFGAPFGDEGLGAWAARRGAIVTVERIVETEEVVAHSQNVRIPAGRVLAVAEAPFGAHPGPLFCGGVEDLVQPYAEDAPFFAEFREACRDEEETSVWKKTWATGVSHPQYVESLGKARLDQLRRRAKAGSWRDETQSWQSQALAGGDPSAPELAVLAGAGALAEIVRRRGATRILAGVGLSNLAAWLARAALAAQGVPVDLMVELGLYGYVPPPGEPYLVSNRVAATAAGLGGVLDILGSALARDDSVGILGAGEVDSRGNLNSSRTGEGDLLVGSGGANDVASIAAEVVVVALMGRRRFVPSAAYVTCPGKSISSVATQHGILEKDETGELVLAAVYGDAATTVERARAECGWDLRVARSLRGLPAPDPDDLALLRAYDPNGYFLGA